MAVAAIIFLLSEFTGGSTKKTEDVEYQKFLEYVENDEIGKVVYQNAQVSAWFRSSGEIKPADKGSNESGNAQSSETVTEYPKTPDIRCEVPDYEIFQTDVASITAKALNKDVDSITTGDYRFEYVYKPVEQSWFLMFLPYIFLVGISIIIVVMISKAQGGAAGAANFSKSRAKLATNTKVTFKDVQGADEEKEELQEIVEFMKSPARFTEMGARIPKGVLLVGQPGTGKTLIARAVAGEANVPFYSISGSDFVEMFVGVGASRVRDLFNTAKKCNSAIIFIDEIDAVGRKRGAGLGGGHDEREQTLNQLLVEMDGFEANSGIIVMAATNRPDVLDPALLRPGRFDRQIVVNMPDVTGREAILRLHAAKKKFASDVSFSDLAKSTPGFSGADLENLLNEAAILATRKGMKEITNEILSEATTRTIMGPEKRSRKITDEDKRITAYHESGHAIAALELEHCDPVREISVIPRGMAAGYTITMPDDELAHMSKGKLLDVIAMTLGGRAAEETALDDICTGAYNDLKVATDTARKMVIEYGMSDKIGPIFLGGDTEVFIGASFGQQKTFSDAFGERVDEEIKTILESQYDRVKNILTQHRDGLDRVANALIEREHLTGDEFLKIYRGEEVLPQSDTVETDTEETAKTEETEE
ncbi:MAG: ATP-dependent zinc metalloprotease FtsH [Clostridia bacterium]|nr:ATP-dependent zinc metalloprotease FtsH [Clostridia bacterium]